MMLTQARVMSWRRVAESLQAVAIHGFLFSFTLQLVLKLDNAAFSFSWWVVFIPLWLFHVIVARGRFSFPAPSYPCDRYWAPFHAIVATPLLVSFELLLCIHLGGNYAINLKIVFLPLLAFETAIFIDNVRMCKGLIPEDEEGVTDEAIKKALPHLWIAMSMVFFIVATTFTLLKLCGDADVLFWWELFLTYGFAECFAFFNCTKWYNPAIHRRSPVRSISSSSTCIRYLDWNSGLVLSSDEDQQQGRTQSLQVIGGHIFKIPLIIFQILLFMRLEGIPSSARCMPIPLLFSPLFLLQGAGLLFAISMFVEKIILMVHRGAGTGGYFKLFSKARDIFEFTHHGSSLLGWWSIDEGSQEEQARLYRAGSSGYNTFSPDVVKKMPRADLTEEIWRLQAALVEQTEIRKFSQEEYEKLQNEKILCRVCFEEQIDIVLLPCRHHILCSYCCRKCKRCPICRVYIEESLCVHGASINQFNFDHSQR